MFFDTIIVTAANAAQAKGYRAQIRPLIGRLAPDIRVIPDPGGRRVGTLGSTVRVLRLLGPLTGRVLICHSGGDSKRLPAYAAIGKAFVPIPQPSGPTRSLFEVIVHNMERLPLPKVGVLVVSGDVAPDFTFEKTRFTESGVVGVAYYDTPERGSRHGVYLPRGRKVAGFLQKPSPAEAAAAGAVVDGKVAVDTGILWIDPATGAKMAARNWKIGDIYADFTRELMAGFAPFHVNVVDHCDFFHIGTSRELLELLGNGREWVEGNGIPREEMELAGRNIVTGVPYGYPKKIRLANGECLTCLPIGKSEWFELRYRVEDDFKRDGKWERLHLDEVMPKVNQKRLLEVRDTVVVEKPLRIDFAGGWSDTPPICYEMGGRVLNAAVTLGGKRPVRAEVRRIPESEVRIESADLGKRGIFRSAEEIHAPTDPHDWRALVKSALVVTGYDFAEGGLSIHISADVPKGSGLGTSSILGAAVLEALERIRGRHPDWHEIAEKVLQLEQEMKTGGGWQDQVGALLPGVKIFASKPGEIQELSVRRLSSVAEKAFSRVLEDRALLYFTGQKRMARNVLRGVLRFYAQNPDDIAHEIIRRLKRDAEKAFRALQKSDWDAFCTAVNGYWLAKKALDPGSTNPFVESIIARIAPWTSAIPLCGAGGGGFMFIIAHSKAAKRKLKSVLERQPPVKTGCFYDFNLVP